MEFRSSRESSFNRRPRTGDGGDHLGRPHLRNRRRYLLQTTRRPIALRHFPAPTMHARHPNANPARRSSRVMANNSRRNNPGPPNRLRRLAIHEQRKSAGALSPNPGAKCRLRHFATFLSLGAGVTPAEGSVKPTVGFTLSKVIYPSLTSAVSYIPRAPSPPPLRTRGRSPPPILPRLSATPSA